jgi:hypothetical protein
MTTKCPGMILDPVGSELNWPFRAGSVIQDHGYADLDPKESFMVSFRT